MAYTIGVAKAVLIILYFMHVQKSSWLTWAVAGSAFLWLGILLVLSMSDYLTRSWLPSGEDLGSKIQLPPPPRPTGARMPPVGPPPSRGGFAIRLAGAYDPSNRQPTPERTGQIT